MIVKIVKNGVDCCGVVTCRMLPAAHPGSSEGYYIFLRYIVVGFMEGYDIFLRPLRGLDRVREITYFWGISSWALWRDMIYFWGTLSWAGLSQGYNIFFRYLVLGRGMNIIFFQLSCPGIDQGIKGHDIFQRILLFILLFFFFWGGGSHYNLASLRIKKHVLYVLFTRSGLLHQESWRPPESFVASQHEEAFLVPLKVCHTTFLCTLG